MKGAFFLVVVAVFSLLMAFSVSASINASDAHNASGSNGTVNMSNLKTLMAANNLAQGGNVSELNATVTDDTNKWQGYFGNVNGSLVLGAGAKVFYSFGGVQPNVVLASMDQGYNFVALKNDTINGDIRQVVDYAFFNTFLDDPTNHTDSATIIYNKTGLVGGIADVWYTTPLPVSSGWQSAVFHNGSANMANITQFGAAYVRKMFAFGVNVSVDQTDFMGGTSDYELMVPVPTVGYTYGSATYYFFMDVD